MYKDYEISKPLWRKIKEDVLKNSLDSEIVKNKYNLNKKQIWFLYDRLLQERYNHLYKRDKIVDPKVGDYVYCDYDGFGKGEIKQFSFDKTIMMIKFDDRHLETFCDAKAMCTIFDGIKRKITRL